MVRNRIVNFKLLFVEEYQYTLRTYVTCCEYFFLNQKLKLHIILNRIELFNSFIFVCSSKSRHHSEAKFVRFRLIFLCVQSLKSWSNKMQMQILVNHQNSFGIYDYWKKKIFTFVKFRNNIFFTEIRFR